MNSSRLSRSDFPALPEGFEAPGYDPLGVRHGIVHLGVGGFHRAHMARYTHDLMGQDETALDWGIRGAGLRTADKPLLDALAAQEGLYCLIEQEGSRENLSVIGSIVAAIDASSSTEALLAAIDDPRTRIVSMTVTENGYHLIRATRTLNFGSAEILADLADPQRPRTVPGILVEAYRRRYAAGAAAFTSLCCDNIPHNGNILRAAVLAYAARLDAALAEWIAIHASFPNSMVDRITPVPTAEQAIAFASRTGIADQAPLHAEIFRQWVIEDRFVAGRPAWEKVGVQFVDDVAPYEFMKLRLLNGSHLAIAAIGQLCGYELIGETIGDPLIRRYMVALMDHETGPTLIPVPGIDLAQYKRTLLDRFANPAIRDTTQRVNTDAPVNVLVDPIRDRLAADQPVALLALGLAAWCRRANGAAEDGSPLSVIHPMAELLAAKAREGGRDATALLSIEPLFGALGRDPRLLSAVSGWLASIYGQGMRATMAEAAGRGLF